MKSILFLGLALVFGLLMGLACSNTEKDPWAKQPKNCEVSVVVGQKIVYKAVPCSGPIDIVTLANESRPEHETRLGGPYKKMAEKKRPHQVFYNGGSLKIIYSSEDPTKVFYVEVSPDDLDFDPEA
ncbi:MAG: hypothetical protein ACRCTY_02780, partial [Candidatus Adiutrix sp.]